MDATPPRIFPYVVTALVMFAVYRRIRRNFGKQPLRPTRMGIRIALLVAVAASLVPAAIGSPPTALGELAGLSIGLALGTWGAQHTRYVTHDGQLHYLPHTYTGIAVTALFLGRLIYRLITLYVSAPAPGAGQNFDPAQGFAASNMMRSPITVSIFFVLVGYYGVYYGILLYKFKHLKPDDIEPVAVS